jgi:hypothetical protein
VTRLAVALVALASLVCALLIARTVAGWRADALRWRGATVAARTVDTVYATRAARVDTVLRTYWRVRSGETRGAEAPRGRSADVTVAPPADTLPRVCDELAEACAAFRVAADDQRRADSVRLVTAHVVAARALDSARRVLTDTVRALRPRWWRPTVTVGAACVASQIVTCGPGVSLGWRIR